jgi:hypothetical protein
MVGHIARATNDEHGMTWYATTARDLEVAIRGFGFQPEPVISKDLADLECGSPGSHGQAGDSQRKSNKTFTSTPGYIGRRQQDEEPRSAQPS